MEEGVQDHSGSSVIRGPRFFDSQFLLGNSEERKAAAEQLCKPMLQR